MTTLSVPGVPFTLTPSAGPRWTVDEAGALSVTSEARTDIFIDPAMVDAEPGAAAGAGVVLNASTLLGTPPAGDFQLSARVTVDFQSTFDAGVLLVWVDDRRWSKLCFELTPAGEPMIVSVVNRGVSDDANGAIIDGQSVWLRVARIGGTIALHHSTDGAVWHLVRVFALDGLVDARVGFEGQSPTGEGCTVRFDDVRFTTERLENQRDGS